MIDFTQHMYSVHDVYEKTFGSDLGYIGLKDTSFNPYGLSIIANQKFAQSNPEALRKFVQVSQRAFLACFKLRLETSLSRLFTWLLPGIQRSGRRGRLRSQLHRAQSD